MCTHTPTHTHARTHSLLYWTNYGEELYTSSLHNLSDIHQIQLPGGERQIRSLTFDPVARTLFWVNQGAETVERYDTDAGTLEVVANNTGTIKGGSNLTSVLAHEW